MNEIIKRLQELSLSPNQYFYLYSLYLTNPTKEFITSPEQLHLEQDGWIGYDDNIPGGNWILRNKGRNLFEVKSDSLEQKFLRFWSYYPIKVGTRILKTKDDKSKEALDIKKKYISLIKKPGIHEKIIKGLENELNLRRKDNSMQYMQLVTTWINQATWEKYCDLEDITDKIGTVKGI